jgi:flagellar hook-length control protein FliK
MPPAAETLPAAVPGPVQVAQIMNRIGQSEMRIGMNTSAFGSVDVRTVVHGNDVGLVIGSEKGDLRTLLANDMPAIANTLQQQNLRLNSVNFMQGFAFSNNASGGGDSRQQSFVPMRGASGSGRPEGAVADSSELSAAEEFASGGLSILA